MYRKFGIINLLREVVGRSAVAPLGCGEPRARVRGFVKFRPIVRRELAVWRGNHQSARQPSRRAINAQELLTVTVDVGSVDLCVAGKLMFVNRVHRHTTTGPLKFTSY